LARRRFFVDHVRHGAAEIAGEEALHLTRVLRVEPGQTYEISDNERVYLAQVEEARKSRVVFRVLEPVEAHPPPVEVTLAAALVKFDRFEWMVEKATELGVARIVPVETERSDKGLLDAARKRVERWRRIARESSQQSRRARLPEICDPLRLRAYAPENFRLRYFFDEEAATPFLRAAPADRAPEDRVCVLTGPEGGWTAAEREHLTQSWTAVSLGPQILRAETAAIAAVALVAAAWHAAGRPGIEPVP
jgi:16S rRNA (uracil1498-N3)-methyltransferase